MAIAKPKKPRRKPEHMEGLQSEVASFAFSLGFAASSAAAASGFDDTDFRKTGSMKAPKPAPAARDPDPERPAGGEGEKTPRPPKGRPSKPNPLEHVDPFAGGGGGGAVWKAPGGKSGTQLPKLPLMRATSPLDLWYVEAAELEEKVLAAGGQGSTSAMGFEKLKRLVERKKEVAERLMAQYVEDYEARTRNHGDWHLVRMAARSGTTSDKVTALATLVGDNPVANMKSLDILLGLVDAKVGKRYAFKGFDHLAELFESKLLPNRKLKCLLQHPVDRLPESSDGLSLLLFWYWEECLKQRYNSTKKSDFFRPISPGQNPPLGPVPAHLHPLLGPSRYGPSNRQLPHTQPLLNFHITVAPPPPLSRTPRVPPPPHYSSSSSRHPLPAAPPFPPASTPLSPLCYSRQSAPHGSPSFSRFPPAVFLSLCSISLSRFPSSSRRRPAATLPQPHPCPSRPPSASPLLSLSRFFSFFPVTPAPAHALLFPLISLPTRHLPHSRTPAPPPSCCRRLSLPNLLSFFCFFHVTEPPLSSSSSSLPFSLSLTQHARPLSAQLVLLSAISLLLPPLTSSPSLLSPAAPRSLFPLSLPLCSFSLPLLFTLAPLPASPPTRRCRPPQNPHRPPLLPAYISHTW